MYPICVGRTIPHGLTIYGMFPAGTLSLCTAENILDFYREAPMRSMQKIGHLIYKAGFETVRFLTLLLAGILTLCSLLWGYYAEDMTTQESIAHREPILLHLAGLAVLLFLLFLALRLCRPTGRRKTFLLAVAMSWICLWGLFLVFCGRSIPAADSASVYTIAQALASGHTGVIHPTDSYLSYYPQQVGLVAFYEIIIRLWNLLPIPFAAHYILQCVNVGMACAAVYFQYKTTCLLSRDSDSAAICYLFLAMLNAPLLFYTSFVYGEIPSFAFLSGGLYLLLRFFLAQDLSAMQKRLDLGGSLVMLVLGVALRKNTLIVIIAAIIVVLWEYLRTHKHSLLLYALLLSLSSAAVLPAIQRTYEHRAGNVLSSGVPAISYVAMGMQVSSRGNGWYNGFNFNTYEGSHLDTAVTAQKSREAIRTSLSAFSTDPGYALRFYEGKFLSQWTDGSYFCRQATLAHGDARREIVESLYTGKLAAPFIHYCNIYQLLVYGGSLTCLLVLRRRQRPRGKAPVNIPAEAPLSAPASAADPAAASAVTPAAAPAAGLPFYVGMIAVLGGFLFHMVWEANSRYIFPYFLLMLPYAALGLDNFFKIIQRRKG